MTTKSAVFALITMPLLLSTSAFARPKALDGIFNLLGPDTFKSRA